MRSTYIRLWEYLMRHIMNQNKYEHTAKSPMMVEGNARKCNAKVTLSSVELNDSTLETEDDRRRRVDVVETEDVDCTEETEDLRGGRSHTLLSEGSLASAVERSARTGAGIVNALLNVGRVSGEMLSH